VIIQHTIDGSQVLFVPEDLKERKIMDAFPGMLRHGLSFYCPNKPNVVYNLYQRLRRKVKRINYTPAIKAMIEGDIEIKEIPEWFKFHTKPLRHQRIALRFAYTFGCFMNLSEPGLGKTKVTLDYIWLVQAKKSLIVCPKALRFVWEEERARHRPELSIYVVETTDWEKELPGAMAADVVVVNYDKAVTLEAALKALKFEFIAVDEGLIKDPKTDRTQALTRLRNGIKYRSVMSGTLVNNSPLDVFSPLRFTEPSLVGESYAKFRDTYAVMVEKRETKIKFLVGYRNIPEVKEILNCCGIIMTKAEWLKWLPPKKFIHKYVQMDDVQRDYYHKLASNYILQIPEESIEIEVDNALSVLCKLNQISNGFIYYKENIEETLDDLYGTEGKSRRKVDRKTFVFKEQPKAKALLQLIQSDEFKNGDDRIYLPPPDDGADRPDQSYPASDVATPVSNLGRDDDCSGNESTTGRRSYIPTTDAERRDDRTNPSRDENSDESCLERLSERSSGSDDAAAHELCGLSDRGKLYVDPPNPSSKDESGDGSDRSQSCVTCGARYGSGNDNTSIPEVSNEIADTTSPDTGRLRSSSEITDRTIQLADRLGSQPNSAGQPGRTSRRKNRRAIIWYNLAAEKGIIESVLTDAGLPFLTIAGGTKGIGSIVGRFNKDPSIQFLLCQAKTINYGVTIMGTKEEDLEDGIVPAFDPQVSDEIFYSLNFSLEVFLQQQDRIHRIGQTRECRYWLILTNSKIERNIAERLEEKLLCNKEILVDIMTSLDKDLLQG
jgi:SNF2 family DNA or RNA helicase